MIAEAVAWLARSRPPFHFPGACQALPIFRDRSVLPIAALWESRIVATDRLKTRII